MHLLTREGRLFSQALSSKIVQIRQYFCMLRQFAKRLALTKKRRSCLREVGVCWLCIPDQLVVSPSLYLTNLPCLLACLLIFAQCQLLRPLSPALAQRVHGCEITTLLSSGISQMQLRQHVSTLANGLLFIFNVFLLEYIWFAVQSAALRGLHAENASHSKVKTCTMY